MCDICVSVLFMYACYDFMFIAEVVDRSGQEERHLVEVAVSWYDTALHEHLQNLQRQNQVNSPPP